MSDDEAQMPETPDPAATSGGAGTDVPATSSGAGTGTPTSGAVGTGSPATNGDAGTGTSATSDGPGTAPAVVGTPRRRGRRIAPWIALGVAVVVAALFVVLASSDSEHADTVTNFAVGQPAPALQTTTLDGKPFDLSRRKGSWVVLNFFNTQCLPCRAEHPDLLKFAEQQASLGVAGAELYTVMNGSDTDDAVRQWFADNGGNWPVLEDPGGTFGVSLGVAQVPETWIVDPQGIIVDRIPSQITADGLSQRLQRWRDAEAGSAPVTT
ncbi:MAG: TlpA disulfide reductase family protein [Ilumatobacteraceae bacterium]